MSEPRFVPVRQVMTADPITIDGLASVAQALELMRDRRISSLVVTRRDAQDEYGLIRIADIAAEVISRNRSIKRVSVYEVMIKPALTLRADMNIRYAVRLLTRLGTSHALVLEGQDLVGIVTLRDMTVRHFEEFLAAGP